MERPIPVKRKGVARVTYVGDKKHNNFNREGVRIEDELQLHHLEQLMYWFQVHQPPPVNPYTTGSSEFSIPVPVKKDQLRKPGLLNVEEFKDTLAKVIGTQVDENQLESLFTKLDTSSDGFVDWNEFCTYMLMQFRERDYMRTIRMVPFQSEAKIRHIVPNKQETTTKIVSIDAPTKIVTFSKEGSMCVWSAGLHLEKSYSLNDSEGSQQNSRRRVKEWITDAVYMANCHRLAIASTGRDIRFYDTTTNDQYYEEFYLYGLPDVPACLSYWYDEKAPSDQSLLLYGDDHGAIHILYFSKPLRQMFAVPFKKEQGVERVYFPDLSMHSEWVTHVRLESSYNEPIRRIMYLAENDYVAICTSDSRYSVVIADVGNKNKSYIFSLIKGVDCFDYNKTLNAIVTGSSDHLVRIWNPYVTTRPVAVLVGHNMGVVDIKIYEALAQVLSCSRDAVVKVWDTKEHTCLQTVCVKFPNSQLGRLPEYGAFPMALHSNPKSVLITANDYIAMLKLGQVNDPVFSSLPMTHKTQLCGAIYNQYLKQVVTAADDSTIGVWDLETGAKSMMYTGAHGNEEITCLTMDETGRRLITGARNGTIKVWNVQNGHNLHQLEAVDDSEITGIIPLADKKAIFAVGWSRKIVEYDDTEPDNVFIKANKDWKGGHLHRDDILTVTVCPPNLLATASFDGEILVWFLETQALFKTLRKTRPVRTSAKVSALTGKRQPSSLSRPNSRHRNSHKPPDSCAAPVDKLMFLLARAEARQTEAAILVSSEAGILRWWSVFGRNPELGHFNACDESDECVLGMCTNKENSLLMTGDTTGKITVWKTTDYCLHADDKRNGERPEMLVTWSGHTNAIVSLDCVEYNDATYLLSASTDSTAKLWTLEGLSVGTFGQKKLWNLSKPLTWVQPPQSAIDEDQRRTIEFLKSREPTSVTAEESVKEETVDDKESTKSSQKETKSATPDLDLTKSQRKVMSVGPGIPHVPSNTDPDDVRVEDRANTFAFGVDTKIGLGKKFANQQARVRQDRQERREHMKGIDFSRTNRYGSKQCCAYQAVHIPELNDMDFPEKLLHSFKATNTLAVTDANPKTTPVVKASGGVKTPRSRAPSSLSTVTGATTSNGSRPTNPAIQSTSVLRQSSFGSIKLRGATH